MTGQAWLRIRRSMTRSANGERRTANGERGPVLPRDRLPTLLLVGLALPTNHQVNGIHSTALDRQHRDESDARMMSLPTDPGCQGWASLTTDTQPQFAEVELVDVVVNEVQLAIKRRNVTRRSGA
jgi:hypothetical protein